MASRLIGFLHGLLPPKGFSSLATAWQPNTDIYRTKDGWLLKFDLAGVQPEDAKLSVAGNRLELRGIRRDSSLEEGCNCYQMEISYSRFERHIILPTELDRALIETEHRHGILLVHIHIPEKAS